MENQKRYVIDTNVLLEDPHALFKLRDGNENAVFIPYHVLLVLEKKTHEKIYIVKPMIERSLFWTISCAAFLKLCSMSILILFAMVRAGRRRPCRPFLYYLKQHRWMYQYKQILRSFRSLCLDENWPPDAG
jgi:hypothetical protein